MLKYLFKPRLNLFDVTCVSLVFNTLIEHQWIVSTLIALIGIPISNEMEKRVKQKETQNE